MSILPQDPVLNLKRPKLLLRAARIGMLDYKRERDLRRVLRTNRPPSHRAAMKQLLHCEEVLDAARKNQETHYNVQRHVRVLTALMAELTVSAQDSAINTA